ncbi:hypothetical protein [Mastigocoleus testarum]|uniref:Bacteriocin n=1 Tax=Mastigocoleus testarum BC008 TaxID=371196 RepID=A0A0V7ZKW9_9CYAN|nr:hypothetical protein [Mastigocoleus testarum]KST65241.1 hypothetical protein BC008_20840 [Mastigocoleus testarum BC008]
MLELTNLKPSNVELTEEETEKLYGGAAGFVAGVANTVWDVGVNGWYDPSAINGKFWTSSLGKIGIATGIGAAFGGPKGAALEG